jgi:hypothetical protein
MSNASKDSSFPWNGMFNARVDHLRSGTLVGFSCAGCGHVAEVPSEEIRRRYAAHVQVRDLPRKFSCVRCGSRGKVTLYVGAALGRGMSPGSSLPWHPMSAIAAISPEIAGGVAARLGIKLPQKGLST